MRRVINACELEGTVACSTYEGRPSRAGEPPFVTGECVGAGSGEGGMKVAVDPLDGPNLIASGRDGALCALAATEGDLLDPTGCRYMEKIVAPMGTTPGVLSLDKPVAANIASLAWDLRRPVGDLLVAILDRPRHKALIEECREAGARIQLFDDGDVAKAIEAADPNSAVDLMIGIGGSAEGVLAACAIQCVGGVMEARLWPRDDTEKAAVQEAGLPTGLLSLEDMAGGEDIFFAATGVSAGRLLGEVRFWRGGATTHSVVMRSQSQTVRWLETHHRWENSGGYGAFQAAPSSGEETFKVTA